MINMFCLNAYMTVLTLMWMCSAFGPPQISIHSVGTIIALFCVVNLVNVIFLATHILFWRYGLAPLYDDRHLRHPHMKEEDARY